MTPEISIKTLIDRYSYQTNIYKSYMYFPLQKEIKKKWDEKNQEAIADAVKNLDEHDKVSKSLMMNIYHILQ